MTSSLLKYGPSPLAQERHVGIGTGRSVVRETTHGHFLGHTSVPSLLASYNSTVSDGVAFFRKPHLIVDGLTYHSIQLRVLTQVSEDKARPEVFEGRIWTLKVRNRLPWFSGLASRCSNRIYFDHFREELSFPWRDSKPTEPSEVKLDLSQMEPGSERWLYAQRVGFTVANQLIKGRVQADLPQGFTKEVYLFFTFKEVSKAFLIFKGQPPPVPILQNGVFVGVSDGVPLALGLGGQHVFLIRFDAYRHVERRGRRFRLSLPAWDRASIDEL